MAPKFLKQAGRTLSMPLSDAGSGRRASIIPSLGWKKSSEIEIVLDGKCQFVHSFSTFDEISGHVKMRFERETCIDDFAIMLQGQTNTWVEKIATTSPTMGRTTGRHTFLRVQQPIDQSCLPELNKAQAGVTYTIPFKFVVPDRILDFTCSHKVDQDAVRHTHLNIPPSIGDPMLSGIGNTLMDDLAPNMARIRYAIRVGLRKASPNARKPELVAEELGVRIVPAREEDPPLSIDMLPKAANGKYCLRKEKVVRKGVLKIGKKQGSLTAESVQPSSLKLHSPLQPSEDPITTTATVRLRFDPATAEEQPPSLNHVISRLKVHTFFGAAPWSYLPAPNVYDIYSTLHSYYPESVDLSTRKLSNVEWVKHDRDSLRVEAARNNSVSAASAYDSRVAKATGNGTTRHYSTGTQSSRSTAVNPLSRHASTFSTTSSNSTSPSSDADSSDLASEAGSSVNLHNDTIIPQPSSTYNFSLPFYTASIVVPITLPTYSTANPSPSSRSDSTSTIITTTTTTTSTTTSATTTTEGPRAQNSSKMTPPPPPRKSSSNKPITFLPTFHSCLISRIYSLELSVDAQNTSTINLRVPIQLSLPYTTPPPISTPSTVIDSSAWYDPLSPREHSTEQQLLDEANDEAIARALMWEDEHQYLRQQNGHPLLQPPLHYHHRGGGDTGTSQRDSYLEEVPEYEAVQSFTGPARRMSLPLHLAMPLPPPPPPLLPPPLPAQQPQLQLQPQPQPQEAPPEYHSTVRRVAAARRASLNDNGASNSTGSASAANPAPGRNSGGPANTKRRSSSGFSLLL